MHEEALKRQRLFIERMTSISNYVSYFQTANLRFYRTSVVEGSMAELKIPLVGQVPIAETRKPESLKATEATVSAPPLGQAHCGRMTMLRNHIIHVLVPDT